MEVQECMWIYIGVYTRSECKLLFLYSHTCIYTHTHKVRIWKSWQRWKPISSLCSLNGLVPFLLFWIPDPPVQPEETLYPARLDTVSLSLPILPRLSATATVSNCFLLSCFLLPPTLFSFFHAFFCGPFFLKQTNDRHWWTQGGIQRTHAQAEKGKKIFCKNLFFFLMKHKKGNKIKINNFFLLYTRKYLSHISKEWLKLHNIF